MSQLLVDRQKWEKMVKAWAENVRLETENAQLEHVINYWKIEAETDNARWLRVLEENERLKAEVERLTKAGDAMHCFLIGYIVENRLSSSYLNKLDDGWVNAREVKS